MVLLPMIVVVYDVVSGVTHEDIILFDVFDEKIS